MADQDTNLNTDIVAAAGKPKADIPWQWVLASSVVAVALVILLIVVVLPPVPPCEKFAPWGEADSRGITSTTQFSEYQQSIVGGPQTPIIGVPSR